MDNYKHLGHPVPPQWGYSVSHHASMGSNFNKYTAGNTDPLEANW